MEKLKQIVLAGLMVVAVAACAFPQKGDDRRPPKDQPKVVEKQKEKPPPSNSNKGDRDRRGKP